MREFDVVLYGASGFTGRQAVRYFSQRVPATVRWAIAGRDRSKLEALEAGVPVIVASSADPKSIDGFVRRTRIVLSTAGPFELYSEPVVDACVRFGAHYVDITGETLWVRSLIDRYHERAAVDGTRVIPFCGFDSVPAEFGAARIVQQLNGVVEVKAYYTWKGGAPNGGTVATGLRMGASRARDRLRDPFLLAPEVQRDPRTVEIDPVRAGYDSDARAWVAPFIMSAINTRVVRRSAALLGQDFAYQEYSKTGGAVQAFMTAAVGGWLNRALQSPRGRSVLQKISPPPGTGPTEQAMNEGWFRCELFARAADGRTARGMVSGKGDPANRVTVKCVCESALTLACDSERIPARAGILTPSTGLGQPLWDRLAAAGITFSVISS